MVLQVRFAVINTVPPGFCRKMHLLAPGGRLEDLANLRRDQLPDAGLSPTHMEAIEGFGEWHRRGISPTLGLLMWYLESTQRPDGSFLRTEDAQSPSVGVAIRYLQIAGQIGVHRGECESVERAAQWLEQQIGGDGLIRMPITGLIDYGMLARSIRSLNLVAVDADQGQPIDRVCNALAGAQTAGAAWPTYPDGDPSTGATSLALSAMAACPSKFDCEPDPTWLISVRNLDGGWGEYAGSPSRMDNTFWSLRACQDLKIDLDPLPDIASALSVDDDGYTSAMQDRLQSLRDPVHASTQLDEIALRSLHDDADRYAETVLYGLAISESLGAEAVGDVSHSLRIRTPEFIRREPPLYDQLAHISSRRLWLQLVDVTASARLAESSIGWLVGLSASIALIGEELVNGLAAISLAPLIAILAIEVVLVVGWLAARQSSHRRFSGVPHFLLAAVLALLLVLLIKSPTDVAIPWLPTVSLTLLLAMIIEVVSVATDKADLLNRLGDD